MAGCTLLPVGQVQPRRMVCFAHLIGALPAPNPTEHFFESRKPRENLPAKTKAHGIQKNVNLALFINEIFEPIPCPLF